MNVPDKNIRVALVDQLRTITYNGQSLQVYAEFVPPDATYPRVILRGMSSIRDGSKSQDMYETDITLMIEDRRINSVNINTNDEIADLIANKIEQSIQGEYFAVNGFRIWGVELNGSTTSTYSVTPHQYTDKLIRITIKTEKNV